MQQNVGEVLFVDRHRDRATNIQILQLRRVEIKRGLIYARRIGLTQFEFVGSIFEELEARIRQTLNRIELAVLHCHRQSIAVGYALDRDFGLTTSQ